MGLFTWQQFTSAVPTSSSRPKDLLDLAFPGAPSLPSTHPKFLFHAYLLRSCNTTSKTPHSKEAVSTPKECTLRFHQVFSFPPFYSYLPPPPPNLPACRPSFLPASNLQTCRIASPTILFPCISPSRSLSIFFIFHTHFPPA